MIRTRVFVFVAIFLWVVGICNADMPLPFTRSLQLEKPAMNGSDVAIMQTLLSRSKPCATLQATWEFDVETAVAVQVFQELHNLPGTAIFDEQTAELLLELHQYDGYKDNGTVPAGFLYKLYVPVYRDRNTQSSATLYAANNSVVFQFTVRCHGQNDAEGNQLNQVKGTNVFLSGWVDFLSFWCC
eukprot:TRINITY_DN3247_c0_g2_i1.p1 TRINITY_DN3247_c0_g2~~TRINITY_DN3247_c0_g2_i1.p1  ORF type:complete len:185 (-),score=25.29 TRINITY_DN3247_c0_g2_i1:1031-1585(-)